MRMPFRLRAAGVMTVNVRLWPPIRTPSDGALYRDKESGRNRFIAAAPGNGDDAHPLAPAWSPGDDTSVQT